MSSFWICIPLLIGFGLAGCGSSISDPKPVPESPCAPLNLEPSTTFTATGNARVFLIDPISSTGNNNLFPTSLHLDEYTSPVTLSHLSGQGILNGKYIDVVNTLYCDMSYGAFEKQNQFIYSHKDWKFQEAMSYYLGDLYRSGLDNMGYHNPSGSVTIRAHCMSDDNAYFERKSSGEKYVCLGDSVSMPGASYADDGIVMVHELQHAVTLDLYSPTVNLNQFFYDEAGALNEAVSDFMGLIFSDMLVSPSFTLDPKIFSRWALGTFDSTGDHRRGAHQCPVYDSHYPGCDQFPAFEAPTSSNGNTTTISYVYPDGLGWPYPKNYKTSNIPLSILSSFRSQEEIHNTGMLLTGALWDIYSVLLSHHPEDKAFVNRISTQLVFEALRHLPMPNSTSNLSPVTFIQFASQLISASQQMNELTALDRSSIQQSLASRKLVDYSELSSDAWLAVGSGINSRIKTTPTPGVYVLDDPLRLQSWLDSMGVIKKVVTQTLSTGINGRLDPGEVVAIWFDLQNVSAVTAGGVLVTVTSPDSDITILDGSVNIGYLTDSILNQTQIMIGKINGTQIVNSLSSGGIPIGNSYFNTNLYFNNSVRTAIWVKVSDQAAHGKVVSFQITAKPANGVASQTSFPVTIF